MSAIENTRLLVDGELVSVLADLMASAAGACCLTAYQMSVTGPRTPLRHMQLITAMLAAPAQSRLCRIIMTPAAKLSPNARANAHTGDMLRSAGWEVRTAPTVPLLHSKIWLFGEQAAVIGSHNLTAAAMCANREVSVITDSPRIISRLHRYYADMWLAATPLK